MKMLAYEGANFLLISVPGIWRKLSPLHSKLLYSKLNSDSSSTWGSQYLGSELAQMHILQLLSLIHCQYWCTMAQYPKLWGVCLVWSLYYAILKWSLRNLWHKKHVYVIYLEGNHEFIQKLHMIRLSNQKQWANLVAFYFEMIIYLGFSGFGRGITYVSGDGLK